MTLPPEFWNISGWVLSAVGILLAVYFWFNPRQIQGQLRYSFHVNDKTRRKYIRQWARPGESRGHIDIWNPSKSGIDGKDIWEPIEISLPGDLIIYNPEITHTIQVNPDAIDVEMDGESLSIKWRYLDSGMAFRVSFDIGSRNSEKRFLVELEDPRVFGRINGFVIKAPFYTVNLPDWIKIGAPVSAAFTVFIFVLYGVIRLVNFALPSWPHFEPLALAMYVATVSLLGIAAAVALTASLNEIPGRILNTKSPIQRSLGKIEPGGTAIAA